MYKLILAYLCAFAGAVVCIYVSYCLYFMISNDLGPCGLGLEPHNLSHLNMSPQGVHPP
jgi:hypothetical protein